MDRTSVKTRGDGDLILNLVNFKCYENYTIRIPARGIYLLVGDSGRGKTTILKGIVYCLYGKISTRSKNKTPYRHGTNSCSATIEWGGLTIKRTSRPHTLTVTKFNGKKDTTYTGDAAQSIIDNFMGMGYSEFMAASYIVQKMESSVISMDSGEQLKFIQTIAGLHSNIETKKLKLKELLADAKSKLAPKEAEIEVLKHHLASKTGVMERLIAESESSQKRSAKRDIEDISMEIKDIEKEIKSLSTDLKKADRLLDEATKMEIERVSMMAEVDGVGESISTITSKLEKLPPKVDIKKMKSDLTTLNAKILKLKLSLEAAIKAKSYRETTLERISELKKYVYEADVPPESKIEEDTLKLRILEDYYSAVQKYTKDIEVWEETKADGDMEAHSLINKLSKWVPEVKGISELENVLEILNGIAPHGAVRVTCPGCKCETYFYDGKLKRYSTEMGIRNASERKEFDRCKARLDVILQHRSNPPTKPIPPEDIKAMKLATLKKEIGVMKVSVEESIKERVKLSESKKTLKSLEDSIKDDNTPDDVGDIKGELSKFESEKTKLTESLAKATSTEREREVLEQELANLKKRLVLLNSKIKTPITPPSDLKIERDTLVKNIDSANAKLRKLSAELIEAEKMRNINIFKDEVEKLEKDIATRENQLKSITQEIEGYLGLEETFKEAEVLALTTKIDEINRNAKKHLDRLIDAPINIRITTQKEVAKTKRITISTDIEYDGKKFVDVAELSGGEEQRCHLAFLLGCCDALGSKILMLDESLNNLNADLNTEVASYIRDHFSKDRIVLVVSHEAVRGLFDGELVI